jgi:pectin methylesterase-like acyl-CoA thioesterase
MPKTLVVPDQYARIQSAVDAAKPGDTMLVKAGVYPGALKFKEGIGCVALTGTYSSITVENCSASSAAANGITINGSGSTPSIIANRYFSSLNGIVFSQGDHGKAAQNTCEQNKLSGIAVFETGTNAVLISNQCRANTYDGILFVDIHEGKAIGNICEQNGSDGICLGGASPFLGGNRLSENGAYGRSLR